MRYDTATGQFTETLTGLDSNRMTVVISHGWLSSPETWARPLAQLINDHHALGTPPNIVAWDWHNQTSFSQMPTPSTDSACLHGIKLGEQLRLALGTGYSQHLHFIGHSLGAIVNSYACDYVHGSFVRNSNNPSSPWNVLLTTPQVTLLDEAEVATVFGQNVTTAAAIGWKAAQLKGALIAGGVAAVADWKNPIPKVRKAKPAAGRSKVSPLISTSTPVKARSIR